MRVKEDTLYTIWYKIPTGIYAIPARKQYKTASGMKRGVAAAFRKGANDVCICKVINRITKLDLIPWLHKLEKGRK